MKIVSIFLVAVFFCSTGWGQEKLKNNSPQMQFSLDGMIGASFGKNFYTLNIGGPVLFLNLHEDFKVGVGLLPSIYSENGKFGTKLGMSPRVDYKSLVFILPFFPSQPFGKWVGSVGIGYKFQKKAK
ncbi:MAG: hypothetical protein ACK5HN_06325 [Bacteroidota bacterium]